MENFNNVSNSGNWGSISNVLNENFTLAKLAIEGLQNLSVHSKGLFATASDLNTAIPSPKVGDYAYVGSTLPATIYRCNTEGTWTNTGQTGGTDPVDLTNYVTKTEAEQTEAEQESLVGYYVATISGNTITVPGATDYVLTNGGSIRLKMGSAGSGAATLQIGSAAQKDLWYNGAVVSSTNTWEANEIISVFYDGTRFMASNSQGGGGAAEKISYDNSSSGLSSTNVQSAVDELSQNVADELYSDVLGKYNADVLNLNYVGGIINNSTGEVNTNYPTWRTSPFLELPSTSTTITVNKVFPRKNNLGVVGCYLYDEDYVKIGYPSNIGTSGSSSSFTFSTGDYPTAKYVRITCYKNNGTTGDDTYISPVYIKSSRLDAAEQGITDNKNGIDELSDGLSEDIPFCFQGEYINTSGEVVDGSATNSYATDYIKVEQGDIIEFENLGWNTASLNHCWGYNASKGAVSMLVGAYTLTAPFNGKITIPSGITYVKAFGHIGISPSMKIIRSTEIKNKLEKFEFNIVGSYIKNDGSFVYNNATTPLRTAMVKVNVGDVFVAKDLFWDGSTTLSHCWGYDSTGSPVRELIPCYTANNPFNGRFTIPSGVSYISAFGRSNGNPELYRITSIYGDINRSAAKPNIGMNYVSVVPDGTNYNLIRTLLASITDASADNPYTVIIPSGSYFECDLKGKKYVTLHGESKENTIIYCDGTSSNVTPSDYTIAADANKPLSSVNKNNKHIFHLAENLIIENCTLQSNDVKYCIHFENSAWAKAIIKDCIFIATTNHSAVGFGLRWAQHAEFHRCEFRVTGCTNAVYTHNWDYKKTTDEKIPIRGGGVLVKFDGCKFSNSGQNLLTIGEIGSFNDDKVVFVNCKTDNPTVRVLVETTGSRTYHIKEDGTYETTPTNVPYCMHLDMINCGVENSIIFNKSNRPDFENYCMIIN